MPVTTRNSGRARSPPSRPFDYGVCPSEPVAQNRYFYAVDSSRHPIFNQAGADGQPAGYIRPPRNIKTLRFDPGRWQNVPRPENYLGIWPPTSASQLLNTRLVLDDDESSEEARRFHKTHGRQTYQDCLGKFCWQETQLPDGVFCVDEQCDHTFSEWLTGTQGWEERFELRDVPDMGCGLYTKRGWKKGEILGAYLGELIPSRTSNTEYCIEINIGPVFEKTRAPVAYIDAEHWGSYARFCNHSCNNNANISEGRVGGERVLVLTATRRIAAGEQVTVDYQADYFRDGQCQCGLAKCRYSKASKPATADCDVTMSG